MIRLVIVFMARALAAIFARSLFVAKVFESTNCYCSPNCRISEMPGSVGGFLAARLDGAQEFFHSDNAKGRKCSKIEIRGTGHGDALKASVVGDYRPVIY